MLEIVHALSQVVFSLGTAAIILLASLGIGAGILYAFRVEPTGRVERATWGVTLGLAVAGTLFGLLGILGILYRPIIGLFTLPTAAGGLALLSQGWLARSSRDGEHEPSNEGAIGVARPRERLLFVLWLLALVTGAATLVSALAPPTAGDALCYHLELPKQFLADHALTYLPYHDNATFPLLGEMWLLWGLALEGPVTAQLLAWCCGWLLAGATYSLARGLLGNGWAQVAALGIVLAPGINNHMSAPLVDVPTALLTTLMLAAWLRCSASDDQRGWAILAGLMLGAACGAKYVALVWGAAWCGMVLEQAWRNAGDRRALLARCAMALVIAASAGGMWYLRGGVYRGNPVYPFLSSWLPSAVPPPETVDKTSLGLAPWTILSAPWQVTFWPEQFGGRGHRLGAIFLMLLPGLVVARRLRGLAPLCALAALYLAGWYLLRQNIRFLYPVAPILLVAATWSLMEISRWPIWSRRLAFSALGLVLLLDCVGPVRRAADNVRVATGLEKREDFLLRREPTYRAACVANAVAGRKARILSQDYRAFYFEAQVTRENVFRRATGYDQSLDRRRLSEGLRDLGFTHLLLVESSSGAHFDGTLSRLIDEARGDERPAARRLACLDRYQFLDSDGTMRNYRLIELR